MRIGRRGGGLQNLAVMLSVLLMLTQEVFAQGGMTRNIYVFGTDAMNPPQDDHRMMVWLDRLSQAGGHNMAADGRSGDLRRFAFELPARAEWDIGPVERVMNPEKPSFRLAGFDTVILTIEPDVMQQPPLDPFPAPNRASHNPVSVSAMLLDWLARQSRGTRILVRQDSRAGMSVEEARDWHDTYLSALREARPLQSVQAVPLFRGVPRLSVLVGEAAASDPAGAAFLEAMLTYGALYSEPPPLDFVVPESLPAPFRMAYAEMVRLTLPILADYPESLVPPPLIPAEGLEDPAAAIGLNGIWDWSTQSPFLDVIKSGRVWTAHSADGGPIIELPDITDKAAFDLEGWPMRMPKGIDWLGLLILTDQPVDGYSRAGRYVLTYEGRGRIELAGLAYDVDYAQGEIRFSFAPGPGLVEIKLLSTDLMGTGDYVRNIKVYREDQLDLVELGLTFNPDWLRHIRDMRLVRFLNWMRTNTLTIETLDAAPRIEDFSYSWRGVPVEVMVDLANEIGADAWFNVPHAADDAYIRHLAEVVRDRLDPRLHAYVEYSNEIWNFIFPQTFWAREQAVQRWGPVRGDGDGWMQFAGMRAAQAMQIWTDVFGEEAQTRLVRILSVHPGWFGLEEPLMYAPLWVEEDPEQNRPPHTYFDAYGVTGYMALMGDPVEKFPRVLSWLDEGEDVATQRLTDEIRRESLNHLRTENYPYHAKVARDHDLDLIMYEGGTHIVAYDGWTENEVLNLFFMRYNYSPKLAGLYAELFEIWQEAGGHFFHAFLDVAAPVRWGSWGHLRHLDDINPRWLALMTHNATAPVTWEKRAQGTFSHGIIRRASKVGARVEARHPRDILLGGEGDDVLVAAGCCSRIHGGAGRNVAILPGAATDYAMQWQNDILVATRPEGEIRLVAIQEIQFSNPGETPIALTPGVLP